VHRHGPEIFYVVEGLFEFRVGGDRIAVGPGAGPVGPRDIPHTFGNVGAAPVKPLPTAIPGRFGRDFIAVDALADRNREAIRRLAATFDVELLEKGGPGRGWCPVPGCAQPAAARTSPDGSPARSRPNSRPCR
jgi:hypothetical protein